MPLVTPLARDHDKDVMELAEFFNETLGFPPNSILTMQRRPRIAKAFIELNKAVMENQGGVTAEQKRLIGYIASTTAGCRYCQAHTALAAERYGASQMRIENVWSFRDSDLYTPAEKVAFELAIAAASVPNRVDAELIELVRTYWDEGEIVEILGVIALFGYLNRWNDSMGTTLEEDAEAAGDKLLAKQNWNKGKHI
ncbi:carboxymuconolactone decarboxylase family protein [Maritalea myrionectae]|uniref:carboxymuconolactone decarboxylase family protein n=1 Tax=Maritalea myrionectae TaxID=454601 RepID=UPI000480F184|nr:carboxymuconolactone decarboxylase family protein [Maritalea myrionectae]